MGTWDSHGAVAKIKIFFLYTKPTSVCSCICVAFVCVPATVCYMLPANRSCIIHRGSMSIKRKKEVPTIIVVKNGHVSQGITQLHVSVCPV